MAGRMYNFPEDQTPPRSVSIDIADGKWVVTIVENFDRLELEFEVESFARSFADGQRYRLGLSPQD
jgi:hypothetical protein